MSKTVIVTGSSGFIGGHLVARLRGQGHTVIGVDIVTPQFNRPEDHYPHVFYQLDLRETSMGRSSLGRFFLAKHVPIDEMYNLACLMGGMGFIGDPTHSYDILVGSSLIVANTLEICRHLEIPKCFFSSSACVYNMHQQEGQQAALREGDAYPAMPDLVYGWQKLLAEQMYHTAYEQHGLDIRIGRFHNIFGPYGAYQDGKEKAPAALCRKVARAPYRGTIEVWGDGSQTRSFLYIDECLEGIDRLMQGTCIKPLNIGSDEVVRINELAEVIIGLSGKNLSIRNIPGPQGVRGRNSDNALIQRTLGWKPSAKLIDGLETTYRWIHDEIYQTEHV